MSRFVFITSTSGWGGSEELWAGAAALLAESGHAVTAFVGGVDPKHPWIRRLLALGCHVRDLHKVCLPSRVPLGNSLLGLTRWLAQLTATSTAKRALAPVLRAHIAASKPDLVVISQGGNFDGLAYIDRCRAARRPYIIVSQKANDHLWPTDKEGPVMRAAFQGAMRCYFVSQHNLQLTEAQIGATLRNAEIVRNPFLVSGTALPWPEAAGQPLKLACVARLNIAEKGQDILLQVLARQRWRDRDLSVSFFGAGRHAEALQHLAGHLALKNVEFHGFVTDVEAIWRTHHALVLPSRTEGLPLALVEAMMCGRFGIVTNEGGNCEVMEDGHTGFIANSAKADELDAAMERAWVAREQWHWIGQAARTAIRAMVPPDPARCFADKLLALVEARELRSRTPGNVYAYTRKELQ
jgi:glycosyltransferase involved in cell wall biosynthesis